MNLNGRHLAIAAALTALATGSWWMTHITSVPSATPSGKLRHDPDYILENFHNIVMTPDGRPQYELRGKRLVHYGDDATSVIDQPYVIQYAPGRAPTHARAKSGFLPHNNSYIRLSGNVIATHGRDPRTAGAQITTQELTLELDKSARKNRSP